MIKEGMDIEVEEEEMEMQLPVPNNGDPIQEPPQCTLSRPSVDTYQM